MTWVEANGSGDLHASRCAALQADQVAASNCGGLPDVRKCAKSLHDDVAPLLVGIRSVAHLFA
jgi:hypothetical protein